MLSLPGSRRWVLGRFGMALQRSARAEAALPPRMCRLAAPGLLASLHPPPLCAPTTPTRPQVLCECLLYACCIRQRLTTGDIADITGGSACHSTWLSCAEAMECCPARPSYLPLMCPPCACPIQTCCTG